MSQAKQTGSVGLLHPRAPSYQGPNTSEPSKKHPPQQPIQQQKTSCCEFLEAFGWLFLFQGGLDGSFLTSADRGDPGDGGNGLRMQNSNW